MLRVSTSVVEGANELPRGLVVHERHEDPILPRTKIALMTIEPSNRVTGEGVTTTPATARGLMVILATIGFTVMAAFFVQPRVSRWLDIREAYRNLSHRDQNERVDAVRWADPRRRESRRGTDRPAAPFQ
jgi:hypothetical protein